jgi:predicted N-acetyltransferase YhbS
MSLEIRVADAADIPALAVLRRQTQGSADDPGFEARFAAWSEAEGDRRTTWVADDGGLIGCTSLFEYRRMPAPDRDDSCWGYLGNMMVVEDRRNAGIGSLLLKAVVTAAEERGYARIVLAPSPRSIEFYRRAGFLDAGPDAGWHRLMVRPAR